MCHITNTKEKFTKSSIIYFILDNVQFSLMMQRDSLTCVNAVLNNMMWEQQRFNKGA